MTFKKSLSFSVVMMCLLGSTFYCYEYYLRVAPSIMRPDLMYTFNIGDAGLGILFSYYYYTYTPLQLPAGIIIDIWGPRKILTFACFICAFGNLVFASTNILFFGKIGRLLIGFGSAFAYVGVLKIVNLWLPKKYFATFVGIVTALGMFGAMSGEIIMSKFVLFFGWRKTLYFSVIFGLFISIILWFFIKDYPNNNIEKKNKFNVKILFFNILKLIKIKHLWINGLIGCLLYLPLTIFAEMWAVPFLEGCGLEKYSAAIGSSMIFLGFAVGGPIWGIVSDNILKSRKYPLIIGSFISSFFALFFIFCVPKNIFFLFLCLFFCGLFASAQVIVFAVSNDICMSKLSATGISFTNMIIMCGGIFFQPLVGFFLDMFNLYSNINVAHDFFDYQFSLIILPFSFLLCGFLSFFLKNN